MVNSQHCISGQFILWKITNIVATSCQMLSLKCTKFAGELTALTPTP